ncbi:hypothetical protein AB0M46_35380 [Dactylosporangium sp. NPDC051485]|uniref:hypothetical protein n=1 Tax=Dactylosporangium sp. NPDC051485 TaxID=3154846 RepID=UPI003442D89D
MANVDRRTFLQMAAAAAVPLPFEQALSIPAHHRHGSIEDVEHVIFLMPPWLGR